MLWVINFWLSMVLFIICFVIHSIFFYKKEKMLPLKVAAIGELFIWGLGMLLSKNYLKAVGAMVWACCSNAFFLHLAKAGGITAIMIYGFFAICTILHYLSVIYSDKLMSLRDYPDENNIF